MSHSSTSVLVIEDDADIRESVVEVLEGSGRNVLAAENGAVAFSKLAGVPRPCLILLDIMMPEMDGLEFLRRLNLRPDARDFVVLLMSANESLAKAQLYPGVVLGTLAKPFGADELLTWVERYSPFSKQGS